MNRSSQLFFDDGVVLAALYDEDSCLGGSANGVVIVNRRFFGCFLIKINYLCSVLTARCRGR